VSCVLFVFLLTGLTPSHLCLYQAWAWSCSINRPGFPFGNLFDFLRTTLYNFISSECMTLNNQNNLELNWRNVVEWNAQISRYQGFLNQKKSKLILLILKSKSILLFVESKSILKSTYFSKTIKSTYFSKTIKSTYFLKTTNRLTFYKQ
jgi:hypothetical protein